MLVHEVGWCVSSGSITLMVRAALLPFVAVLLIAAFLGGAGAPMPSVPVVLMVAVVVGWALRKKRPRDRDEE